MLNTDLCKLLVIKYPIIQAALGPFSSNKLYIATANVGILGLLSTRAIYKLNAKGLAKMKVSARLRLR